MKPVNSDKKGLTDTYGFLLTKVGQAVLADFAARLEPLGLRPRHCGLLAAVAGMPTASQQELGQALGLVPSAMVPMIDDLEALGAVKRVQGPANRRRYAIELTAKGKSLLTRATGLAHELDTAILADLTTSERAALKRALGSIVAIVGLGAREKEG